MLGRYHKTSGVECFVRLSREVLRRRKLRVESRRTCWGNWESRASHNYLEAAYRKLGLTEEISHDLVSDTDGLKVLKGHLVGKLKFENFARHSGELFIELECLM